MGRPKASKIAQRIHCSVESGPRLTMAMARMSATASPKNRPIPLNSRTDAIRIRPYTPGALSERPAPS